jgi:hypothetical protein
MASSPNQNIKLMGKQYNPNQGQIPANQQAARAARAAAPKTGKPKSAMEVIKGVAHRGMENFLDNMRRPVVSEPAQREHRKGRGSHRESHGESRGGGFDVGPILNPDMLDLGSGEIDFSQHPDPMYHNIGGGRGGSRRGRHGSDDREGAKSVTVTRTTYHY